MPGTIKQQHVLHPAAALQARKGRGAVTNLQGRFETQMREADPEAAAHPRADLCETDAIDAQAPDMPRLQTVIHEETARSILTRNQSPDLPFSLSLNPYRGCEHGCVYCFARPSHSYLGLSPGLDFESRIFAKVNAPELLRQELARPSYQPEAIAIGVNTDAYQPCERELGLTRRILEVMHACGQPAGLITKSSLIERDIDLLADMARKHQAAVAVTITTLDAELARKLEPRATTPSRRLRTIRMLADAGIPVGVSIAPIIPFVTEPDIERIVAAASDAGATRASYIVLRLPWELGTVFRDWLQAHFPDRAKRVMARIHDLRGGKDNDSDFGTRMRGQGPWADMIRQRFKIAVARHGLNGAQSRFSQLDTSGFRRPLAAAALLRQRGNGQMQLFGD